MKNTTILMLMMLITAWCHVAAQKMPTDYFDEGQKYTEDEQYKKAIEAYQYIVSHYSKNELYPMAFFNVGYLYYEDKQYDSAALVMHAILRSTFNEKQLIGGDIMSDPYANYRHRASQLLSEICYDRKMYDTALYYFALSDTAYPYLHFCGNELAENEIATARRYADIYLKLGDKDKAISHLLPAVFVTLSSNAKVISQLKELLKGRKGLQAGLDRALDAMYPKTYERKPEAYRYYFFRFLGAEINVPGSYEKQGEALDKTKAISDVKGTAFYKMIAGL